MRFQWRESFGSLLIAATAAPIVPAGGRMPSDVPLTGLVGRAQHMPLAAAE